MERVKFSQVTGCELQPGFTVWFNFRRAPGVQLPFGLVVFQSPQSDDTVSFDTTLLDVEALGSNGLPHHGVLPFGQWKDQVEKENGRTNYALYLIYVLQEVCRRDALCLECTYRESGGVHFRIRLSDDIALEGHGEEVSNLFVLPATAK